MTALIVLAIVVGVGLLAAAKRESDERLNQIIAGDIGEPVRRIEFEPLPDEVPIEEPLVEPKREAVPA